MGGPLRVLVVDDSSAVCKIVKWGLELDDDIEVVGLAGDAEEAWELIDELDPDVMTLDVEMPGVSGVEFLRQLLPKRPIPVVMLSAMTQHGTRAAFEAIAAGAIDFVPKPTADIADGLPAMLEELRQKVRVAARVNMAAWGRTRHQAVQTAAQPSALVGPKRPIVPGSRPKIVAIGASTGGTDAIAAVLRRFSAEMPGMVLVQHMPAGYTKRFAESLDETCALRVKEAEAGDRVEPGVALLAPGDEHLRLRREGTGYRVVLDRGERVSGHRPSVDVLFESVASVAGADAVGVILTGMGRDGARGLLAMRNAGARTVAQDEASSVVFGMPKVAIQMGGAERVASLDKIAALTAEVLG